MSKVNKLRPARDAVVGHQPPVHVHVLHPDGKAVIDIEGKVTNDGLPSKVIKLAVAWVLAHGDVIAAEWKSMNNPTKR